MIPFSSHDLGRVFDARTLTKGRTLILLATVEVAVNDPAVDVRVEHLEQTHTGTLQPALLQDRVVFFNECSCGQRACAHLAAGGLAALERFPGLRRAGQQDFLASLVRPEGAVERQVLVFELAPADSPAACSVSTLLQGARTGRIASTTPAAVLDDPDQPAPVHTMARLLGAGDVGRIPIGADQVDPVLGALLKLGKARWHAGGKVLKPGADRSFASNVAPDLPPRSAVILGATGPWYVNAATGEAGRVKVRKAPVVRPKPTPKPTPKPRTPERPRVALRRAEPAIAEPVILEAPVTPMLRLRRVETPDETGRILATDAITVEFDYEGTVLAADDERQFVKVVRPGDVAGHQSFVRRDTVAETAVAELLRTDGFNQMRIPEPGFSKGRIVHLFRGRDASERWQAFMNQRMPSLVALGWRNLIDKEFGPRTVEHVGDYDLRISDVASGTDGAEPGEFELDFGIEIDGARQPLLPILTRLLERGGMEAALIVDGQVITSLDDGRILKLPAERIRRLLTVMADLIDAARRTLDGGLVLKAAEASTVLELEELLPTRWDNAAAIEAYAARFRGAEAIEPVAVPASFKARLRPYQQHGVNWLQHLRASGLGGFLADDMGLGKTAQTIAHIVIEHEQGRLDRPALVVVPTSLVANWRAELTKFAPHLTVEVLHGLDRHAKREELDGTHVVITTYTVLARDVEAMRALPWHIVVLDEAQVIKSPDAKATRAVCQLDTRHRVCLSGTPIENNLQEMWSEFAFLMPGLLGDRKGFAKRFRTPIEKNGDLVRRMQLVRRIRPFLLRRTKFEVATDLPPKHTILRRVNLAPEQRELYETIRGTLHDTVREQLAGLSAAQGRIVMLDALLKLRQVCCDPRLVKLPSARLVDTSSKLDELMEMVGEMIAEGRRILLFSQFTSMLDLIKPRLAAARIPYVELRGDTRDRAEPVRIFESGAVPLFLISLKAGGRGLNLVSADTVIHYDPWWNPAAEDQASDRAHRIGQTKSVFVYKLIAADTVEDRIVELQQRKSDLARIALGGGDSDDTLGSELGSDLGTDDVDFLFGAATEPKAA